MSGANIVGAPPPIAGAGGCTTFDRHSCDDRAALHYDDVVRFRDVVAREFERRCQQNPRYSLRGFARAMGVHHATLSRLLTGAQPIRSETIATLGPRIGLPAARVRALIAGEDIELVIRAVERPTFRPQSRWLASIAGIPVDRVNIALQTLLRRRQLKMLTTTQWSVTRHEGVD